MEDLNGDFSSLSLKEIAGNRVELLNKIQKQIWAAINTLVAGSDLLTNEKVGSILHQVNKNIDLIKASCNDEGIFIYAFI